VVEALAAGASEVVDITYSLSRRDAKDGGHGSVGEETFKSQRPNIGLNFEAHHQPVPDPSPSRSSFNYAIWDRPVER